MKAGGSRSVSKIGSEKLLSVGLFGAFHPHVDRVATFTTGIAERLARSSRVAKVIVLGNLDSTLSPGSEERGVELLRTWAVDQPLTLIQTIPTLVRTARKVDLLVFNIYPTSFGARRTSNFLGLTLPCLTRILTHRRVLCYLHNALETQDVNKLGYRPTKAAVVVVELLERLLAELTILVMPLDSQVARLPSRLKGRVHSHFIPYMDVSYSDKSITEVPNRQEGEQTRLSVLLFGSWGPQKDIRGGLGLLKSLSTNGLEMFVRVVGGLNQNFPGYQSEFLEAVGQFPSNRIEIHGRASYEEVGDFFRNADFVFLPYRAAGGSSGVMNLAAFYDCPVISYDDRMLRECASKLNSRAEFISGSNANELLAAIQRIGVHAPRSSRRTDYKEKLEDSLKATEALLDIDS